MTSLRSASSIPSCLFSLLFMLFFSTAGCQAAPSGVEGNPADTEPAEKAREFRYTGNPDTAMA